MERGDFRDLNSVKDFDNDIDSIFIERKIQLFGYVA